MKESMVNDLYHRILYLATQTITNNKQWSYNQHVFHRQNYVIPVNIRMTWYWHFFFYGDKTGVVQLYLVPTFYTITECVVVAMSSRQFLTKCWLAYMT
jgi:hypothetical protein